MRAPAGPYVTALAPLLARWLKRRRHEHGETCERSEDFSDTQLLFFLRACVFFSFCTKPPRCAREELHLTGTTRLLFAEHAVFLGGGLTSSSFFSSSASIRINCVIVLLLFCAFNCSSCASEAEATLVYFLMICPPQ